MAHAESTNKLSGDILHLLIPASAYVATYCLDDKEGRKQFYKSFLTNVGVTYALKIVIDKDRPNGTNEECVVIQLYSDGHCGYYGDVAFLYAVGLIPAQGVLI